jgi:hypothetical protein
VTFEERVRAVANKGFTDRQARFLVTVMLHSGVCMDRQYCAFARIRHGQKTEDFFGGLVKERAATIYRCAQVRIAARSDLPEPSYVLYSSPNRVHIFWRVTGFEPDQVEALQKRLAGELDTDPAATPATQATRIPGFFNHKPQYVVPHLITIDYRSTERVWSPADFPIVQAPEPPMPATVLSPQSSSCVDPVERARRYLARVPAAIAGEHGDVHTFRVCCRLVRGFALRDDEALDVLTEWNARCQPPWTKSDLQDKLRRARCYGREPLAALLRS